MGATKKPQIDALVKAVDFGFLKKKSNIWKNFTFPINWSGVIAMNPVEPQAKLYVNCNRLVQEMGQSIKNTYPDIQRYIWNE